MKYDIKTLTLDEKLKLLAGRNSWQLENANGKLPDVFLSDGPHGLRMYDLSAAERTIQKATAMPNLCVVASTWDEEIARLQGATIAEDCIEKGADVLLAPGVNIKRTPLCGRNFEYFSEDPYLAGVMGKAYIEGVQSKGVGTSLKHYCANNREYDRYYQTSEVDERTLREIYLLPFEIATKAQPWTVMCAYNPINGVYASENKWLLNDILREEFGFDGLIVSDWNAVHNSVRAVKATIDLEMPYREAAYPQLKKAYEEGWLTDEEIDARVEKILALMEKTQCEKSVSLTKEQRHEAAATIAREGMVLLKNEDDILPLTAGKIVVNGPFADAPAMGGGGSAYTQTDYRPQTLAQALSERLGERAELIRPHGSLNENLNVHHIKATYKAAYNAEVCVLCVGTGKAIESESFDRANLRLSPTQEDLILGVAKINPNVVVVLHSGSAVDVSPWIDKVKAVLWAGFSGEGGQEAIADILTGKVCPSGKLTETYPLCLDDTPTGAARGNGFAERYDEGVFVGYRYYDRYDKEVRFPFGHGLSYAKFEYSDLQIEKQGETDYEVSFSVTNVSAVDGKEVAQVYVRDVFAMVTRPEKELKGFKKVALKAGESKRVRVKLCARSFAYYSVPLKKWHVENGDFEILIGASSRDIRLTDKLTIELDEREQYSLE